jgi:hypothetical protein
MADLSEGARDDMQLLERIDAFVRRFVVLPDGIAPLLATWVVHTHAFAAAEYTPYVVVASATRGCGKSRLLEALELLVARPLPSANVTAAALYRSVVEGQEPTMLLDEQDGLRDEATRKVLNAGFRRGSMVTRTRPKQDGVDSFPAFCPKVIASIGGIPATVADRSIRINMKRRLPHERVEMFHRIDADTDAASIREHAQAFAERHLDTLAGRHFDCPDGLDDRGCDIFQPLFAIADVAGSEWAASVREAAVANREIRFGQQEDPQTELLRDIRAKLDGQTGGFVFSNALVYHLVADASLRWGEWNRGRGLTQKGLSMMLGDFGISSGVKQVEGVQRRGYFVKDFEEPFLRYLGPPETVKQATINPFMHETASVLQVPSAAQTFKTRKQIESEKKLMD